MKQKELLELSGPKYCEGVRRKESPLKYSEQRWRKPQGGASLIRDETKKLVEQRVSFQGVQGELEAERILNGRGCEMNLSNIWNGRISGEMGN